MHYKDGTPAAIGDQVKGKPYNTDHEIAGVMVSITPGSDSCNCKVAFLEVIPLDQAGYNNMMDHVTKDAQGNIVAIRFREDYGQCSDFLKAV